MTEGAPKAEKRVLLIGHRGFPSKAPENTLVSFRLALEVPVDMVELDVHLSKDRHIVVIHDATLERTTNGHGAVRDHTLAALKQLDAGSWFAHSFGEERIPELAEVFDALPEPTLVNVEIKSDAVRDGVDLIERLLGELIVRRHLETRVLVSSFHHGAVGRMKSLFPAIETGVLYAFPRDMGKKPAELARLAGAEAFICSRREASERIVKNAQDNGLKVIVYGLDTPEHINMALDLGTDGVVSNVPDVASEVLKARNLR
ncbi:MAG: glycerophosphodiester phosphodiesterase [Ignavibacteriales bacterium CG07_land_8_20_14_0_80_59_12]|nr:MAG: glycerophosphodiester phosphodiesterase [Ignavibacteriales bacterium CG07_land_8_20_14_0_80_59_12]